MRTCIISCSLWAILFLTGASRVQALSLLDRSPFIWPDFQANEAPTPAQQATANPSDLEFHAIYELSGQTKVLLKDRRKNEFYWLSLGEETDGMLPKQYNREKDELLLAYDNQEKWISLQALPQASPTPVVTAQPTQPATTRPATQNTARRRVIRPSTRSSSATTRNVIRPTSRSGSSTIPQPPRGSTRRPVTRDIPGLTEPSFTPPDPGFKDPVSEPPESTPVLGGLPIPQRP